MGLADVPPQFHSCVFVNFDGIHWIKGTTLILKKKVTSLDSSRSNYQKNELINVEYRFPTKSTVIVQHHCILEEKSKTPPLLQVIQSLETNSETFIMILKSSPLNLFCNLYKQNKSL